MSLQFLGSLAALLGTNAPLMREAARTKPAARSAKAAQPALQKAMVDRMAQVNAKDIPELKLSPMTPDQAIDNYKQRLKASGIDAAGVDQMNIPTAFAPFADKRIVGQHGMHYGLDDKGKIDMSKYKGDEIIFNPNASAEVLAHEMGHAVSAKTKAGEVIRNVRNNPKLARAIAIATGTVPMVAAAVQPGDDEYDEAILGTAALAAPSLIDEGLATKNALAMMDNAGIRATLGQRARLAGGLLSYLAVPMVAATGGTAFGNMFDQDETV